jgi:hypothetical protein
MKPATMPMRRRAMMNPIMNRAYRAVQAAKPGYRV